MTTATLTRWRENVFAPFEGSFGLFPFATPEIRLEQVIEDGKYLVRAEIPGVDPDKEIELTVVNGVLRISAERTDSKHDRKHSEFHYGKLVRSLALPPGAKEDTATATYTKGVLEIAFTLGEIREPGRHIEVTVAEPATTGVKEVNGKAKK